jgi:RND family efflux transporter MFP subunit
MKKTKLLLGLAVSVILCSCSADKSSEHLVSQNSKAKKVKTVEVMKENGSDVLSYSGIIVPMATTPLSFQLPGTLHHIYVDEGDHVRKGQLIATQNKTSYESSFVAANAMKKQAQDSYNRLKLVYDKGSLPEIKWEEVKSKLEQANSAAEIAQQNLLNCEILAPSDGIIASRNAEVGSTIIPGHSIFKLIKIEDVYVRVSVPENEINKIRKGQVVNLIVSAIGQNVFTGKVEKIGVMANPISKTYEIKIRVSNKMLEIKPGMVCNVDVMIQNDISQILIPYQTVIKNGVEKNYVFKVNVKTNKVEKRSVEVAGLVNNKIQIISGLKVGDVLVVEGQHKLTDKDQVTF